MGNIYHYFINTDGVGGWWKRILSIIIVPILFAIAFVFILGLTFVLIPFLLIYWVIRGKFLSFIDTLNNWLAPIGVHVDKIEFSLNYSEPTKENKY